MSESELKRSANFTMTEINLLVDLVMKYKSIIENKRTDATTWIEKNKTWQMVCNEFNASSGNFDRTAKALKAKYETIKKNLKKKCSSIRREQTKTGGGIAECSGITAFEEKVMSMTECSMIGMPARFDNDNRELNLIPGTNEVEYIEDGDILDFLKNQGEIPLDDADLITTEELPAASSTNTLNINVLTDNQNKTSSSNNLQVQKTYIQGTKTSGSKFIHKNKQRLTGAGHHAEMIKLKKEVLTLQKQCFEMEIEKKRKIHDLIVSNLETDLKIKGIKLRKLRTSVSDEDGDEEPNTNYSQYLDSTQGYQ